MSSLYNSLHNLLNYCEAEDFRGWDPYDGLNSKVAHALLPLKHSAFLRLCIIQGFKRCPVNLRRLALVPKQHNAKGIGLFLQGYTNLYWTLKNSEGTSNAKALETGIGTKEHILEKIKYLADLLLCMRSDKPKNLKSETTEPETDQAYHGACWGYNFDWQARRLFLFPAHTPTVVATNFCATALLEAYEVLKDASKVNDTNIEIYKEVALSAANFVIHDLHRSPYKDGFLFSYSKLPGNDTVFNASILGSRLLSYCYKYTGNEEYKELARKSLVACCSGQKENGAWIYGMLPVQNWVDSFHTGYNLDGLIAYQELTGDDSFSKFIENGFEYYIQNFFEADGTPKYYDNRMYPIDIHCPGQLFVTLSRLHKFQEFKPLAQKVLDWTIANMQDKKGYFYYQLKPGISSKISYMRWSNAFMFCSLSYYLKETVLSS